MSQENGKECAPELIEMEEIFEVGEKIDANEPDILETIQNWINLTATGDEMEVAGAVVAMKRSRHDLEDKTDGTDKSVTHEHDRWRGGMTV